MEKWPLSRGHFFRSIIVAGRVELHGVSEASVVLGHHANLTFSSAQEHRPVPSFVPCRKKTEDKRHETCNDRLGNSAGAYEHVRAGTDRRRLRRRQFDGRRTGGERNHDRIVDERKHNGISAGHNDRQRNQQPRQQCRQCCGRRQQRPESVGEQLHQSVAERFDRGTGWSGRRRRTLNTKPRLEGGVFI
jgi:hypothetical protein